MYNVLSILYSICISYDTRYDTIWYMIHKNKKTIHDTIHYLTIMFTATQRIKELSWFVCYVQIGLHFYL